MSIKRMIVPIETANAGRAALKAAAIVAAETGAEIEALHIRQRPQVPATEPYAFGATVSNEFLVGLEEAALEKAAALKRMFDEAAKDAPAARWVEREGVAPFDIGAAARVADLAVFGRTADADNYREAANLEETLFQSGRPVLLASGEILRAFPRRVLFAWNGSREAARAMGAAAVFFSRAEAVGVVTFGAPAAGVPGPEEVARTLRLHGVAAEIIARDRDDRDAEGFIGLAREWRADLGVMGAYSHARWRQIVLGGFTRGMLAQKALPVLMAH
jgi:nucleotide-binding universal stress UspA family protein